MRRRQVLIYMCAGLAAGLAGPALAKPVRGFVRHDRPRSLPKVTFQNLQGEEVDLNSFAPRTLLLNLWASWCLPCLSELPSLDRLSARIDRKKFAVLAVSVDLKGWPAAKGAFARIGMRHLHPFLDDRRNMTELLKAPYLPTTLLIDAGGREAARFLGPADWESPQAIGAIETLSSGRSLTADQTIPLANVSQLAP